MNYDDDMLGIDELSSLFQNDCSMFLELTKENSNVINDEGEDEIFNIKNDVSVLVSRMSNVENDNILQGTEIKAGISTANDLSTRVLKTEVSIGKLESSVGKLDTSVDYINQLLTDSDSADSILSWETPSTIDSSTII